MGSSNLISVPHTKLSFILTLFLAIFSCSEATLDHGLLQETNITLYIHDYFTGPNATNIAIGNPPDDHWAVDDFGTMYCKDSPMTETADPESDYVGRAQGTFVSAALDGSSSQVVMSLVFETDEYQGSTLQIQGAGSQNHRVKELSVVAGTGGFRYARGYATSETIYYDREANYSVAEWNVTMEHFK
ncbi:hypothetical protein DCAR_0209428 [Daucus carota subsp. sativus]|uniref:Dirigent protein n=1 Tax=Daucus carota subsp. sativus TaxID=79200 RepID=A0A162AY37_DAUCS|nr:PREDICTED: dirigent protein 23-like [Daucus carota subsp. sativus]WOG90185.1 hypothetical protein DCAR_0209428 [Daucus carota subsp. sativus]